MNRFKLTIAIAALLVGSVSFATTNVADGQEEVAELNVALEPVRSFHSFGRFDNWRAVDRDTLIVWTTAFRPYLIELRRPSSELRFARAIGISSTVGRVSRLDEVYIDGWPYPIKAIYRLTPEQARSWKRT